METSTGLVLLDVVSVRYPIVEGRARPGSGEVLFDVTRASRAESVAGATLRRLAANQEEMQQAALVGKLARGQPAACPAPGNEDALCPGLVHLDLREASRLETQETSAGKSVLVTLAVVLVLSLVI